MKRPSRVGILFFLSVCLFFFAQSGLLGAASSSESQSKEISSPASQGDEVDLQKWGNLNAQFLELFQAEDYEGALDVGGQILKLSMDVFGPSHANTALALIMIASIYEELNLFKEAEPFYLLALDIHEEIWGATHVELLPDLRALGLLYLQQKQLEKAESFYARALSLHENAVGPKDLELTRDLENLALVHRQEGNNEQAESLYQRAIAIYDGTQQSDSLPMFLDLQQLSFIYVEQERVTDAIAVLERALPLGEAIFSAEDPTLVQERRRLAKLLLMQKRYGEASGHFERILELDTASLGSTHPQVALDLVDLAHMQEQQLAISSAEELLRRALAIQEEALDPQDPTMSETLMALGTILLRLDQPEEADLLFQRSLRLVEDVVGERSELLSELIMRLAMTFEEYQQFDQAEKYALRALDLQKTPLGPHALEVAENLMFLSGLYLEQGVFSKAEEYYQEVLEIYTGGDSTIQDSLLKGGLVPLVLALEQHQHHPQAARVIQDLQEKGDSLIREDHPLLPNYYSDLALLSLMQQQLDVAEEFFNRSLALRESRGLAHHPDVVPTLGGLALLKRMQKAYGQAEPYLLRSLQIGQDTYGSNHPQTTLALEELGFNYALQGRYAEALPFIEHRLRNFSQILPNILWLRSESEKFQIMQKEQQFYLSTLSLIWQHLADNPQARKLGMESILTRKGLVLSSQTNWQEIFSAHVPPNLQIHWEQLLKARADLAKLWLTSPKVYSLENYQAETRRLQKTIRELGALLGAQTDRPLDFLPLEGVSLEKVARALPAHTALIEFVKSPQYDWGSDRWGGKERYLAWILKADASVDLVDLGEGNEVEQGVNEFLKAVRQPPNSEANVHQFAMATRLYSMIWKPLVTTLKHVDHIIVSPDGILNLLPFAALQSSGGRFVIEDYSLVTVNSGRDLLRTIHSLQASTALFLAANPDYSWVEPSMQGASVEGNKESLREHLVFSPLPSTIQEASVVPSLVSNSEAIFVKTGPDATEATVLSAPSSRIFHLATHGFFLDDVITQTTSFTGEGNPPLFPPGIMDYEDPLFRSGLAFAGANHASRNASSQDGLLTAFEVAQMNLHETDLVVLSACDTGYGETRRGEGVYGLRRAFSLAGARNLVMSLWPVWDKQATKQMKSFYTSYGQGMLPAQALRTAQLERIAWMRKYMGEAPPSLWAPFLVQTSRF